MSITAFPSNSLVSLLDTTALSLSAGSASSLSASASTVQSADHVHVSGPAKLLAELQQLSQSNPGEFLQITTQIAQELHAAANNASDPQGSSELSKVAGDFEQASKSGSASDLIRPATGNGQPISPSPGSYGTGVPSQSSTTDTVSQVFSNALSQIQTDLGTSPTRT